MRVCVRLWTLSRSHFFTDFHQIGHRGINPKSKNEFVGGQYRTTPSPILPLKTPILDSEVLKIHAKMKKAISALNVHESPKIPGYAGNRGREHDGDVRFLTGSRNMAVLRMRNEKKICNLTLICGRIAEIPASYRKSGSRNTMVTSDF